MKKSLKSATNKKIIIGKIGAAHGVRGDMKVYPLTDFPDRFNTIKKAYVDDKEINIISTRYQGNFVVMKVEGVNSREEVARFTNKLLKINRSDVPPLEDGEYYVTLVYHEDSRRLGLNIGDTEIDITDQLRENGIYTQDYTFEGQERRLTVTGTPEEPQLETEILIK